MHISCKQHALLNTSEQCSALCVTVSPLSDNTNSHSMINKIPQPNVPMYVCFEIIEIYFTTRHKIRLKGPFLKDSRLDIISAWRHQAVIWTKVVRGVHRKVI